MAMTNPRSDRMAVCALLGCVSMLTPINSGEIGISMRPMNTRGGCSIGGLRIRELSQRIPKIIANTPLNIVMYDTI